MALDLRPIWKYEALFQVFFGKFGHSVLGYIAAMYLEAKHVDAIYVTHTKR